MYRKLGYSEKKRRKEIWLMHKAVKTTKRKYKVYRKYKNSKHPACMRADKKAHKEIRRAKYNFERKLADNIKKDTKSIYAYVRSKAKAKINVGPLVNKDGEVISRAEDMIEEFNKFFISVFTNEGNESIPEAEWMYKRPRDEQLCDLEITEKRVLCELDRLRDDKAADADDLVPRFLSKIKGGISYPLTLLFQRIMEDREVPDEWSEANVVPIFKNGSRGEASNYRLVSLTSQISKVIESIIRDEIVRFLERYGVIKETQHGFRKGK